MNDLAYDVVPSESRILVRTRSDGMFGFLAHDLELEVPIESGSAQLTGSRGTGKLRVAVSAMRVRGVLRGKALRTDVLSSSDVAEIARRMEALTAHAPHLDVDVRADGGRARVHLALGQHECTSSFELDLAEPEANGDRSARARGSVTLSGLGIAEVRGPLGAFKVRDEVEVEATIRLHPRPSTPAASDGDPRSGHEPPEALR